MKTLKTFLAEAAIIKEVKTDLGTYKHVHGKASSLSTTSYINNIRRAMSKPSTTPPLPENNDDYTSGNTQRLTNRDRMDKYPTLGGGIAATGHIKSESSGENIAYKVMRSPFKNGNADPTIKYLKHSMQNSASNPHLPKVYGIHSTETKDGSVHIIKMERLHPMSLASKHSLESACNHATKEQFKDNEHIDVPQPALHIDDYEVRQAEPYGIDKFNGIKNHMIGYNQNDPSFSSSSKYDGKTKYPISDKLQEVKNKVDEIVSSHNNTHSGSNTVRKANLDLHTGNYMLRHTPYGANLVVTDPIYAG